MALELLKHHIYTVELMAQDSDYTPEEIAWKYLAWSLDGQFKGKKVNGELFQATISNIIHRRRDGEQIIPLAESTNEGDAICQVCPKYNEACWHGHTEYEFVRTPSGLVIPEMPLPEGNRYPSWYGFSVDLVSSEKVKKVHGVEAQWWVGDIAQKYRFRMDTFDSSQHPDWALDPGIRTAISIKEFKPVSHAVIWEYATSLLQGFPLKKGSVTVRVSDSHDGTSLTPAKWRERMDQMFRSWGFAS